LEFLRYPQLIPRFFNTDGSGPPRRLTAASPWPWVGHPVSGLPPTTPSPLQTRFRSGSGPQALSLAANGNSPAHSSIGTPSVRALRRMDLGLLVGIRFQVLFHSPDRGAFHLSLAVLSPIGRSGSLALEGGPPSFPQDSPCPAVLGIRRHPRHPPFAYGALTPCGRPSQAVRLGCAARRRVCRPARAAPPTPPRHRRQAVPPQRFGLRPVRSPLLGASRLISCPHGTEMFQFPCSAPAPPIVSAAGDGSPTRRVPPFGHPRITACVRLPEAYRSLPRPSSALSA
jgi:hypothetical protein